MTTVCVVGDSHLAAMKLGWDEVASEFADLQLFFFGAPGYLIEEIRIEDGAIVPTGIKTQTHFRRTSGGRLKIKPIYDRFLLCGMKFAIWRPLVVYEYCRAEDDPKDARRPLSDACYRRAIEDYLEDTPCIRVAKLVRAITDVPIGVVPVPFPSETSDKPVSRERARRNGDEAKVADHFARAAAVLGERIGFRPLFPPATVLSGPLQTKAAYSQGSMGLALEPKEHGPEDHLHMNARYGAEALRAVLPALVG